MTEFLPMIPRCHQCGALHPKGERWVKFFELKIRPHVACEMQCVYDYINEYTVNDNEFWVRLGEIGLNIEHLNEVQAAIPPPP